MIQKQRILTINEFKMRTNIEIDDELMKKALKYSKLKTKKDVIDEALNAYVKYQMRLNLLSLQGKVKWVGDLDKMRRNA